MASLGTKKQILEDGGYVYNFDRKIYFNRNARKVFSVEFVEDHSEEELQRCIAAPHDEDGWQFYFNRPPSRTVSGEIERVLG